MTIEEFLKYYSPHTATAIQKLAASGIEDLQVALGRVKHWNEQMKMDHDRIAKRLNGSLQEISLNTCGEYQSTTTFNLAMAEFMFHRDNVRTLLEAVEKERNSGQIEYLKKV